MKDLDYLFIKSKSYEELLKKAYDSGKNLGFDYESYLLSRCNDFNLLFRLFRHDAFKAEVSSSGTAENIFSQSQDKVLSFYDDDEFSFGDEDIFSQSGVVPHSSHNSFLRECDFMYPKDVREYLNISKSSYRRLIRSKKLIPIGTGFDGTNYYLREDVEALKNR